MSESDNRPTALRRMVAALGWLAVLGGLAGVLVHVVDSRREPVVLLASVAPYLMCGAVLGLVVLALVRSWISVAASVIVVGLAVWTQLPIYVANGSPGDGPSLTVMQANLLFGGADAESIVREVESRTADVLTVSELTPEAVVRLHDAGLDDALPHRYVQPMDLAGGTGIWSRYPISATTNYDGFALNQLSARIAVPKGPSTLVFALHPVPPYPYGPRTWETELEKLGEILAAVPEDGGPVIVGADFNATYDHPLYRKLLTGRYQDAADQAGAGALPTWPADRWWPPVIGIDHIILAGGQVSDVDTVKLPGSDHRGVVARLTLDG